MAIYVKVNVREGTWGLCPWAASGSWTPLPDPCWRALPPLRVHTSVGRGRRCTAHSGFPGPRGRSRPGERTIAPTPPSPRPLRPARTCAPGPRCPQCQCHLGARCAPGFPPARFRAGRDKGDAPLQSPPRQKAPVAPIRVSEPRPRGPSPPRLPSADLHPGDEDPDPICPADSPAAPSFLLARIPLGWPVTLMRRGRCARQETRVFRGRAGGALGADRYCCFTPILARSQSSETVSFRCCQHHHALRPSRDRTPAPMTLLHRRSLWPGCPRSRLLHMLPPSSLVCTSQGRKKRLEGII